MGVSPECERVDGAGVADVAGRLEEGRGVGRCVAGSTQKQDPGRMGLRDVGVLQEDAGVVARARDRVDVSVVDLEDQILDLAALGHPEETAKF